MRLVALLVPALALAACNGAGVTVPLPPGSQAGTPGTLERNGVSVAVPPDWDGRVLFRDGAGTSGVVFQVANFELPGNEGFEPPQELPPGHEDPIKAMSAGDVLVTIVSDERSGEPAPATISLADLSLLPAGSPRIPVGHALAQASFCRGERCVRIEVDFGERSPAASLQERVNRVLASLRVGRA